MAVLLRQICLAGLLLFGLLAVLSVANAQPAQPESWCTRWTDGCTVCSSARGGDTAMCRQENTHGRSCTPGPVRCTAADQRALNEICERSRVTRTACNSCGTDSQGRRMCTLILCPVRAIVCQTPRRAGPI